MNTYRGYYSLMQYCPDHARMEALNVGVVLLCPELNYLDGRISDTSSNQRIASVLGPAGRAGSAVQDRKESILQRLRIMGDEIRDRSGFDHFIATRANDILLTPARPMVVTNPEHDLVDLYNELVGGGCEQEEARQQRQRGFPEVERVFERPSLRDRVLRKYRVTVPVVEEEIEFPYAYRNGRLHLIRPERFTASSKIALGKAERVVVQGDLIQRSMSDSHLVVMVPYFDQVGSDGESIARRFGALCSEYGIQLVEPQALEAFAVQLERQVHA